MLLARGVWELPFLSEDGHFILVAIDSHHRKIAHRFLMAGENPRTIKSELWDTLDQADPEHSRRLAIREHSA